MANLFNVSSLISKTVEQSLHAKSMLVNTVDKSRSKDFTQKEYTPGETITIEIEPQATFNTGRVATLQDRLPKTVTATLGQYNAAWPLASLNKEYDLTGSEVGQVRFGRIMANRLIREIERTGFQTGATYFGNAVGSPGTEPGSIRVWAEGRARIDDQLATGKIYAAASPLAMVSLADSLKGASAPADSIGNQYITGQLKDVANMMFYQSNSTYRLTNGTAVSGITISAAPTNGSTTLILAGTNGQTVTAGTHITVGTVGGATAVYNVDQETKQNLPYLYKFVVVTGGTFSGGVLSVTVGTGMYDSTDSRQNMSALPAAASVVNLDTTTSGQQSQANMIYTPESLSLISVPLAKDSSGGLNETFANYEGLQVRTAIHPRDAINDTEILRVDACWAWTSPRPEQGCIVYGG